MFNSNSASTYRSHLGRDQETERPKLTPEQERWRKAYPTEFKGGATFGFSVGADDPRQGWYPRGFHQWDGDRKNAWYCGWHAGYLVRKRQ
jgi:hypothetical protein